MSVSFTLSSTHEQESSSWFGYYYGVKNIKESPTKKPEPQIKGKVKWEEFDIRVYLFVLFFFFVDTLYEKKGIRFSIFISLILSS